MNGGSYLVPPLLLRSAPGVLRLDRPSRTGWDFAKRVGGLFCQIRIVAVDAGEFGSERSLCICAMPIDFRGQR